MKPIQKTQICLPGELHRAAKLRSIEDGITLNETITRALSGFLRFKAEVAKRAKAKQPAAAKSR